MGHWGWGNLQRTASASGAARAGIRTGLLWVLGAVITVTGGCEDYVAVDSRTAVVDISELPVATKPTGSQDCDISGAPAVTLSLRESEFSHFLRSTDAIPLWFDKDIAAGGMLTLHVVVTSFDAADAIFDLQQTIPANAMHSDVEVRLSDIALPTAALPVSRHLTLHAVFTVSDEQRYEGAGAVRLYFHPDGDGWQLYEEVIRDRDYSRGALTDAERAKREAALGSLPAGVSAVYVDARVTKLSDDPEHVPPDDATDDEVIQ